MDYRNYGVTNRIAECLDDLKIFNACRCENPRDGRIIVEYENDYFLIEISPLTKSKEYNPKDFKDAIKQFRFLLESKN